MALGPATERKIEEVAESCRQYGSNNIIVLSGVPGTGKTLISLAAAQLFCGHPLFVKPLQFHPSYTYEDFIEGLRPTPAGGFEVRDGVFLEWNAQATKDPENSYCLLIEEFTRANINSVLGELLTYIEYRDRDFVVPLSRRTFKVAANLTVLATMNPRDRSALEVDDALIRRLRIIECPPDTEQLEEMLEQSLPDGGEGEDEEEIIDGLVHLFDECKARHPKTFNDLMPFGHGMFAGITSSRDLYDLWHGKIKYILRRPLITPHPFTNTIEELYVWKDLAFTLAAAGEGAAAPHTVIEEFAEGEFDEEG